MRCHVHRKNMAAKRRRSVGSWVDPQRRSLCPATVERSLFRAKRINHCNDFVARVALEVVDSSWWKQQLRVKSAGSRTTALSSNEGGIAAAVIRLRVVSVPTFFRSSRFSLGGVSTRSKLPGSPEDARNRPRKRVRPRRDSNPCYRRERTAHTRL